MDHDNIVWLTVVLEKNGLLKSNDANSFRQRASALKTKALEVIGTFLPGEKLFHAVTTDFVGNESKNFVDLMNQYGYLPKIKLDNSKSSGPVLREQKHRGIRLSIVVSGTLFGGIVAMLVGALWVSRKNIRRLLAS